MPDMTIQARLDALRQQLDATTNDFNILSNDLQISNRIESANAREIEKLKRHVAKLQHPETGTPIPSHDTHADGL